MKMILSTLFFRINVTFKQPLPKNVGLVLACNHVGWLDIICLAIAVWPRQIHFMAKNELFCNRIIASVLRSLNAFPVNRAKPGPSSLKTPLKLLRDGKIVGIFPSGTRNQENVSLKKGVVTIAQLAGVPIIPAFYNGPAKISWSDLFRKSEIRIILGSALIEPDQTVSHDKVRDSLMEKLTASLASLEKEM
jgi:1-acyl-sn-glycerol-3-phosphate acyltransferase